MKTVIYYFSGTGNSLQIARDLATYLSESKLSAMSENPGNKKIIHKNTRVGLVFPTYVWGLPNIVREFVPRLQLEDCFIFSAVSCGGNIGAANRQLQDLLEAQGMKLSAGFQVRMPGNYIRMYPAQPPDKIKKILVASRAKVREIAKILNRNEEHPYENGAFWSRILAGVIYKSFLARLDTVAEQFRVTDRCASCGNCAAICPSRIIKIPKKGAEPQWNGHCEQCLACIQWCPEEAIEFGNKTKGRRRYHYPGIRAEDIIPKRGKDETVKKKR
ncbi:MAG: EFR1 family ferrodoxin [Spirochaetota bacterium]|nr:EFR1 family ferrodoxin [Spirochaetota bacterium]